MLEKYLRTEEPGVYLRPFYSDAELVSLRRALRQDQNLFPPDHVGAPDHHLFQRSKFMASDPTQAYFGIWHARQIIGDAALVAVSTRPLTFDISYSLSPACERDPRRYASPALKSLAEHAINLASAKKVQTLCFRDDVDARTAVEDAGFDNIENLGPSLLRYSREVLAKVIAFPKPTRPVLRLV
ncbi:MAG TPA: GNAT family N-acetyltransferase [Candidatus Saccharimonadales bacterium]|nr:GNAT family N-acetyltransferase [Candidatus Saccharimonadales bacterium]